jgi:hypothetical protein
MNFPASSEVVCKMLKQFICQHRPEIDVSHSIPPEILNLPKGISQKNGKATEIMSLLGWLRSR